MTLVALLVTGILGYASVSRLTEDRQQVARAHQYMTELESLLSTLKDAETGQRGYLLTGKNEYRKPYDDAVHAVQDVVDRLKQLASSDVEQAARLAILEPKISERLNELERTIDLAAGGNRPAALQIVQDDTGKAMMDGVRGHIAKMQQAEMDSLTSLGIESDQHSRTAALTAVIAACVGIGLLGIAVYLSLRNQSQRERAAQVVAEQGERLRTTLASIGDAVITTDIDGRITNLNAVAELLTGWKNDEAMGRPLDAVFKIVNESTRKPVENPAMRALSEGAIVGLANHTVLIAQDGTERAIDDSAAPIRCKEGQVVSSVLIFRDISERRKLQRQAGLLASIVETSEDAVISKSLDGIIQSWNSAAERLFGYTAEAAVGQPMRLIIPDDRAAEEGQILTRLRAGERIEHFDTVRKRADGTLVHVSLSISPVRDEVGTIIGASKIARDVTERVLAQEKLKQLADRQAYLVSLADTLRQLSDPIEVQAAACRALGEYFQANRSAYFEIRGEEYVVERDYVVGVASLVGRYPVKDFGADLLTAFYSGQIVVETDALTEPNRPAAIRAAFEAIQVRGHVDVPLIKNGLFIAGMTLQLSTPRSWSAAEVALVEETAERTWAAVERARAEAALQISEEQRRLALDAAELGAWNIDPASNTLVSDDRFRIIFHGSTAPLNYEEAFAAIHPEDRLRVRDGVALATNPDNPAPYAEEYRVVHPDGSVRWVLGKGRANFDTSSPVHRVTSFDGTVMDITARKHSEEAVREARSRLESTLAAGEVGTWEFDVVANVVRADQNLARMFGVPPEAATGLPIEDYLAAIHPDDRDRVSAAIRQVLESGDLYETDCRLVGRDGSIRWVVARGRVERDAKGLPMRLPGVVVDITGQRQAEEELSRLAAMHEAQRRLYEAVLTTTPDLAYIFDRKHRFTYVNQALLSMWGRTWEDAINKTCLELGYEPWHAAMHDREIDQVVETGKPIRGEVPFTGTNGRRIYDYVLTPVVGADGRVEAVAGITRDVTDRKQLEDELRRLAADLSEADHRKDVFLATLAHELRNPLAPIRSGLQVMKLASADADMVEQVRGMMERQTAQMVRLIDDLMDLTRISSGKLVLQKKRLPLATAVQSAVETSRPLVQESGHQLILEVADDPIFVHADETRLSQVFTNLINNAAKYTERGGRITIQLTRDGEDAVVAVEDTGVGIPADMLPKVFDIFTQVDRSLERSQGGLGIGLSIVRKLVEMHGGTIEAQSEGQAQGSRFVVRLPVALKVVADRDSNSSDSSPAPTARRRVLIADDNLDSAVTLSMLLKIMGSEVIIAHDGLQALELGATFQPNLVLLDIGMPKLNGYETCRRMRQQKWGKEIVIVACTGWGQEEDRRQSNEAGFDFHVVKPIDPAALEKLLAEPGT